MPERRWRGGEEGGTAQTGVGEVWTFLERTARPNLYDAGGRADAEHRAPSNEFAATPPHAPQKDSGR